MELEEGLEGLVYASEIDFKPPQKIDDLFKVGDKIKVKVIKVDVEQRKIGLSTRTNDKDKRSP